MNNNAQHAVDDEISPNSAAGKRKAPRGRAVWPRSGSGRPSGWKAYHIVIACDFVLRRLRPTGLSASQARRLGRPRAQPGAPGVAGILGVGVLDIVHELARAGRPVEGQSVGTRPLAGDLERRDRRLAEVLVEDA